MTIHTYTVIGYILITKQKTTIFEKDLYFSIRKLKANRKPPIKKQHGNNYVHLYPLESMYAMK
jgi:hypothetical protein